MTRVAITTDPIRPEDVLEAFATDQDGAVLLFLGVVRNHHKGRRVEGLVYEAYREMAEETLALIAAEAGERFGTDRIRVLHRIGSLRVGEVSTAIATATPHREEGFGASRYVIEEIKKRLPVWKLERYVEGDSEWVEGRVPPVTGGGEDPPAVDPAGADPPGPSGSLVPGGPGSRKDPGGKAGS